MIDNLDDFLKTYYNVDQKQVDKWYKNICKKESTMYKATYKKLHDDILTRNALEVIVHGETPMICRERLEIVKDDWGYDSDFKLIKLEKT